MNDRIERSKRLRKLLEALEAEVIPPNCADLFAARDQLEAALADVNAQIFIHCTAGP